ncbi:MAG TPA: hypothetical protein VKS81_04385 [Bacteroidota bacterium]|nr:hypothetical protein [Bacteroidota bacterium]
MDSKVLFDPWRDFALQLAVFLPKLCAAFVILVVGWMIAKVTQMAITKTLKVLKIDVLSEKAGVEGFLKQGGMQQSSVSILGILVYWILMLIVLLIALNSLGLQTASDLLNRIILYIPNVIVAVFVLIIGLFFANLLEGILETYLSNTGVKNAAGISNIARYALIVFVVSVALEQLNIGKELVVSGFQIAFGAVCLALALAFGLGGRDWAAGVIAKMQAHQDEHKGGHGKH